jgi:hypothetical protein
VRAVALLVLCACGEAATRPIDIERVTPEHGPLVGGTRVTVQGSGFSASARVLVDGREPRFALVLDDTRIEVIVPPGERAGDAEVVVFDTFGSTSARGVFRYSTPPTIDSVAPADVVAASASTIITVHGSGFLDEDAGNLLLAVGGQIVEGVTIESDTSLTFAAPTGRAFAQPQLELVNARGRASLLRAFRYTPGVRPGLLLFSRYGASFAVFYDPVDHTTTAIPALPGASRVTSVIRESDGTYWAVDRNGRFGRLDLETQTLTNAIQISRRMPAIVRVGDGVFGLSGRNGGTGATFGTLDTNTGAFTQLGTTSLFCCGAYGVAFDGTTVWFTARQDWTTTYLSTIDPMTGVMGTPVALAGGAGFHVEELRAWGGTLYATSAAGVLVQIDSATGAVTPLTQPTNERYSALEAFE